MQETWVPSLGLEDALEKEMATHSSILARKSSWTEKPGRLQSTGQRMGHDWSDWAQHNKVSVQFSRSVVSDSQPHESKHARPPCPSPTPGVYSNSCPSSRWCHPAISSFVVPFSSWLQSLPASYRLTKMPDTLLCINMISVLSHTISFSLSLFYRWKKLRIRERTYGGVRLPNGVWRQW